MAESADDSKHWLEPPAWWKKSKPLRWVPILVVLGFVLPGLWVAKSKLLPAVHPEKDRFTEVASDPVMFLDEIKSYDTLDAVKARLDAAKVTYKLSSERPPASGKYPPRDRDTIVANYNHLGNDGQLTLEFFNNRLYEATFVPGDELTGYIDRLHAADKRLKKDRNGRAEQVAGNLRIASNVDFANTEVGKSLQTKPYVIWQDLRLVQQLDEWDRRFIALPTRKSG